MEKYNNVSGNVNTDGDVIIYGNVGGKINCSGNCTVYGNVNGKINATNFQYGGDDNDSNTSSVNIGSNNSIQSMMCNGSSVMIKNNELYINGEYKGTI